MLTQYVSWSLNQNLLKTGSKQVWNGTKLAKDYNFSTFLKLSGVFGPAAHDTAVTIMSKPIVQPCILQTKTLTFTNLEHHHILQTQPISNDQRGDFCFFQSLIVLHFLQSNEDWMYPNAGSLHRHVNFIWRCFMILLPHISIVYGLLAFHFTLFLISSSCWTLVDCPVLPIRIF